MLDLWPTEVRDERGPMKEPSRYLRNARQLASSAPRNGLIFTDPKPVREACGTAYLAVLEAIDAYLLCRGVTEEELPKCVGAYRNALKKLAGVRNGRLLREFESLYYALHIAGYYRGLLRDVTVFRQILKRTEDFIKRLGVTHAG